MARKVMIATPAHDGAVCVQYAHSIYHTGRLCAEHGIDIVPIWLPGESLIQRARNELLRIAVDGDVDDLIFIDADQGWDPRHVLTLLGRPVDAVGAPIRKKTDESESYNVRASSPHIPVDPRTGLMVVEGVGTGFLRLSRKAVAALWNGAVPYRDGGRDHRMVFEVKIIEGALWSEDTVMCAKLRHAGIPVHLDPSIVVEHVGGKTYSGDFRSYLGRLNGAHAAS